MTAKKITIICPFCKQKVTAMVSTFLSNLFDEGDQKVLCSNCGNMVSIKDTPETPTESNRATGKEASLSQAQAIHRLLSSVNDWNAYRTQNPDWIPDLSNADLRNADLRKAGLRDANLSGVNLEGALLGGADCCRANFSRANLWEANFGGDLQNISVGAADCRDANFSEAELFLASFYKAKLSGANFCNANCATTRFDNTDLSNADFRGASFLANPFLSRIA